MSDSVVHCSDSGRRTERSMQSYQSAWMSHWTKKSHDAAVQNRIYSSNSLGKQEHGHGNKEYLSMTKLETVSNTYGPVKGIEQIEAGTSKVKNDDMRMTLASIRNENVSFRGFPTDIPCQNWGRNLDIKDSQETCNFEVMRPQIKHNPNSNEPKLSIGRSFIPSLLPVAPNANDTLSRECQSKLDDVSQNANQPVKTLAQFKHGGFAISRPWPLDFTASTSHVVQHGFDHGDDRINLLPSYVDRSASSSKEQLQRRNLRFLESDHQRHSANLGCGEKIEIRSKTERPESSCVRQEKELSLQINSSTSNNHLTAFGGEQLHNIQNFAGFRLSQNQSKSPEVTKSEKFHHGYNSIPNFLNSVHDMETMRICTTVDSVMGVHGGHPRFSQTTRSLFITKKTGFNLNKENETFRNSRESASGNLFGNIHHLSPPFGDCKKGVKLQPIGDSKDNEVEQNAENVNALSRFKNSEESSLHVLEAHGLEAFGNYKEDKRKKVEHDMVLDSNLKNESSAETDIMELDEFEEKKQFSGVNSWPSNKIILGSAVPQLTLGSTYGQHSSELAGRNFELPALPASRKKLDDTEPSTSRTQSLDMETLLANAKQFSHSESEYCFGTSDKPEPSCKWVKRLKLSSSDSFSGTKSTSLVPSHKKNNLVLTRNQEGSMVNRDPSVGRHHGKELMVLDKTTALSRQDESISTESSKSRLLSHSWIQRWRHGQATNPVKKLEPVVFCEPQSSKLALEDLQKEEFPSIAAMALVGKALRGFQPCQFQKKGSLVVWN